MKTKSRTLENPQAAMRDFQGEEVVAAGGVCDVVVLAASRCLVSGVYCLVIGIRRCVLCMKRKNI